MRRTYIVMACCCGVILLVFLGFRISDNAGWFNSRGIEETARIHEQLIDQDVFLTHALNLQHASQSLLRITTQMTNVINVKQALSVQLQQSPHTDMFIWSPHLQDGQGEIRVGQLPTSIIQQLEPLIQYGKQVTLRGETYVSPKINDERASYVIVGMPSKSEPSTLFAVFHQNMLHHVKDQQRKSLRLEAYPHEHQSGIQTYDAQNIQPKSSAQQGTQREKSHYRENEIVVRFQKEPTLSELTRIKSDIQASHIKKLGYTYVFITKKMNAFELKAYFQKWPIIYAEPHFLYMTNERDSLDTAFVPNDQFYAKYQWNLPLIETPKGWQFTRGTEDIIVAVIDTGVDLTHPDLTEHLLPGKNIIDPKLQPVDELGHGTHVAGIISAMTNNDLGIAGMTWFNKVMPIKVLDDQGAGSTYAVAMGIIWATDHGAKVINLSLGNYADSAFLHDAIQYAYDHDVALIAASGNDHSDRLSYPAAYPEVFAVGASDAKKKNASFSNYGNYIDVTAPGVSIASTYPKHQYAALSGTSMASPHVAALAALIRSTNPRLTNVQVYDIIRQTSEDLGAPGKDPYFGYGLIHVERALQAASGGVSTKKNSQSNMLCE